VIRSSTRAGVYKPPYGGFVDMDVEGHKKIKLRTLVSSSPRSVVTFSVFLPRPTYEMLGNFA
jgi:hypothetical protein